MSHTQVRTRSLFAAAALALALLGDCANVTFDFHAAEAKVRSEFKRRTGVDIVAVSCPAQKLKVVKGETFICTVETGQGAVEVDGTLTDNAGHFTWKPAKKPIDTKEAAEHIRQQYRQAGQTTVTVSCPPTVFLGAGASFTCTVTDAASGSTTNVRVRVQNDEGELSYTVESD